MFIRPFISYYVPKTHIRMGIAILAAIIALILSLAMDVTAHELHPNLKCMLSTNPFSIYWKANETYYSSTVVSSSYYIIFIKQLLSRWFYLIVFVTKYEFILAQSPHAMKGLLIGLSFAIHGLFRILGGVSTLPFVLYWKETSLPSCSTVYFAVNIVIGVITMEIFIYCSKRYKNRIRDELCPVYRYVDEYYSKLTENNHYNCKL